MRRFISSIKLYVLVLLAIVYLCGPETSYAFSFFGGIFPILIYDNLTTAFEKVLRGRDRIEQEAFSKFKAYYRGGAITLKNPLRN